VKQHWTSKIKFTNGYRSGLEAEVAKQLETQGVQFEYETKRIPYLSQSKYIPDFILPNGIIIEAKGRLTQEDRSKMRKVKEQHPDLDIRFVFTRSSARLSKTSKTTYAEWCQKYGFPFADKVVPLEWITNESTRQDSESHQASGQHQPA
jgi:hypothetical protein